MFKANLFAKDKVKKCVENGGHFPGGANVVRPTAALRQPGRETGEGDHSLERWTICTNCGHKYKVEDI